MNNQSQPFVSVVIPVLNDSERLKLCLENLEHQTYPKHLYEVIVVDNGSEESIEPAIAQFSQAKLIFESRRGSYAARNKGILLAQGDVIAFTDSDCLPALDWIEKGTAHLLCVPNCGLVAGKIDFFFKNPEQPTGLEFYDSISYLRQKRYVEDLKFGATANVFTFKKVLQNVGLFDTQLQSCGDKEWGERVFAAGYQQIYADDTCVTHPARSSFKEIYKKTVRIAQGSYELNRRKDASFQAFWENLSYDLKPPFRSLFRIWLDNQLCRPRYKIEYAIAILLVKYVTAWEKTKLRLREVKKIPILEVQKN